ncbi:hypothetical protein [Aureivirga marina]|uniref:hypothetical protein n=1 Tax=Aureivirga marina TaxID=1182451 RepID=UPI0018CA2A83|nr:hypothetical protein [Aureivirga marina]
MQKIKLFGLIAVMSIVMISCGANKKNCSETCEKDHSKHKELRCDHSKSVEIKEVETSSSKDEE